MHANTFNACQYISIHINTDKHVSISTNIPYVQYIQIHINSYKYRPSHTIHPNTQKYLSYVLICTLCCQRNALDHKACRCASSRVPDRPPRWRRGAREPNRRCRGDWRRQGSARWPRAASTLESTGKT